MSDEDNGFVKIKPLALYSNDGSLTVSIKNGYPRFTFFPKDSGEPKKPYNFISAPMDMKSFGAVGYIIKMMAESNEDRKKTFIFKNKDPKTQELFIQSVMVIARRGNKILVAMKRNLEGDPFTFEITNNQYVSMLDEDGKDDVREINKTAALWYADFINSVIKDYSSTVEWNGGKPNSQRTKEKEESKSNIDPDDQL